MVQHHPLSTSCLSHNIRMYIIGPTLNLIPSTSAQLTRTQVAFCSLSLHRHGMSKTLSSSCANIFQRYCHLFVPNLILRVAFHRHRWLLWHLNEMVTGTTRTRAVRVGAFPKRLGSAEPRCTANILPLESEQWTHDGQAG